MADEFQMGSGNWWDTSRTRFDTGSSTPSSTALNSVGSFGWPAEMVDIKSRSGMAAASASDSAASAAGGGGVLADPNLQFMGLGLSSQGLDWNQSLLRGEKSETSFRSILQEDLNSSTNFQQQDQWRQKSIYSGSSDDSSMNEFKQINRGFSLDEPQFSTSHMSSGDSTVTCQGLATSFQVDSAAAAVYGGSTSNMLQGFFGSDNLYGSNYGMGSGEMLPTNWPKFSQILRNSPPKQPPPPQQPHLHFSNNAPFWNASAAAMNDVRSSFFPPSAPTPFPTTTFDEKPKNTSEMSTVAKKSSNETSNKRARNETPSPLPAFKVRKEKMGDRITALQQLVSPFGKTDTASVLSEAIEYIKFLHEQVSVLSNPYMKNGAPMQQHQQHTDKSKDPEGQRQDLRSRGLCLVPVSSTFPVTHETTVDFWTPTFGR